MSVLSRKKTNRQDLLGSYTEVYGAALRRSRSLVALQAAKVDAELAYRARGAFLASMNHELRTPLNAITGFAGLLRAAEPEALTPDRQNEYLDYILQSAELLLSHLDMLIEVAAAESGGSKLARCAFDIGDVVRQSIDGLGEAANIDVDVPEQLPLVDADPDKVATALGHLFAYARQESPDTAQIHLTVRQGLAGRSAGFVYVAMEVPGLFLPTEELNAAYKMFDRIEDSLDRKFDPRHLGLPIARSFVELNGGKFNLKSTEASGTLIRFSLPVAGEAHQELQDQLVS